MMQVVPLGDPFRYFGTEEDEELYNSIRLDGQNKRRMKDRKRKLTITKPNNKEELRKLLINRLHAVQSNPELLVTGRWTMSTVFYTHRLIVDKLRDQGVDIAVAEREHITNSIKDVCEEMGLLRHELGIIAAARAQLYFRGQSMDVGIDEISKLIKVGTDLIIIEKEGAVEALGPFADKYGIALLYTRGFATEYALEVSKKSKSNIAILTDFDASGLLIAGKLAHSKNIHWLGIRPEMVEALGIRNTNEIEEKYNGEKTSHYGILEKMVTMSNNPILKEWLPYLSKKRIEIDSVLARVSNEDFWNYILKMIGELFPTRNYNRSIVVDDYVMPSILEELIDNISYRIEEIQEPKREEILRKLRNVEGFFKDIDEKEIEIADELKSIAESYDNEELKNIVIEEINKLFNSDYEEE